MNEDPRDPTDMGLTCGFGDTPLKCEKGTSLSLTFSQKENSGACSLSYPVVCWWFYFSLMPRDSQDLGGKGSDVTLARDWWAARKQFICGCLGALLEKGLETVVPHGPAHHQPRTRPTVSRG